MSELDINLQAEFIRQEHRLFNILSNWVKYRNVNENDPRKEAANSALIWRIVVALLPTAAVGGVGFLGVFLAFQANYILTVQNTKIEEQNHLSESSRRSSLIFELTSILDKVHEEILVLKQDQELANEVDPKLDSTSDYISLTENTKRREVWPISDGLQGRIIALSKSLRPYFYYDYSNRTISNIDKAPNDASESISGYELIDKPLSPERGQLIISLVSSKVNTALVLSRGDFMHSALEGADLSFSDLKYIDFSSSDLRNANFRGADLSFANLSSAVVQGAIFENAILEHTVVPTKEFLEGYPQLSSRWKIVPNSEGQYILTEI